MNSSPPSQAGFTLIEALVAMAVLALGAVSLLSAAESHTARIGDVTQRVSARWAAEYRMSALRLGLDAGDIVTLEQYGGIFDVRTERRETSDSDLQAVTLRVSPVDSDVVLYVLDGYLDRGGTP